VSIETIYDIIKDGHGQKPIASITKEIFELLRKNNIVDENSLQTYKARTYHNFNKK
jgi:hypothetical protein